MADLKRLRQNLMTHKNSRRLAHLLQNNGIIPSSLDRYGSCEDTGNSPDLDFKAQNSENACPSNKGRESHLSYSSEDLYCPFCMCNFLSELKHALHMQVHGVTYYEEEEEEDVDDGKDEPKNIQIMVPSENLRAHPPTPSPQETDQIMIFPISNTGKESKTVKPKSAAAKRAACKNSNPPLTLVIKKSKTQYEVQRTEEPPVPVSPAVQLRGENCDIQSDSATETIDIESSSPSGSPSSIQSDMPNLASDKTDLGKRFCCPECQKQYPTKYALKRHRVTHSEERPFACTFPGCQSTFKLKPRLTDHIRTVHNHKNSRKAKKRSKSLPDTNPASSSLAQALLIPSTLSAPNSALPTLPTEQPVNETSSTAGSNSITAVGAVSNGKSSAKAHPFKCPVLNCNRDFRNGQDLESHMCLHTGQKPLKCSLCKFVAILKVDMDFHMKSAHPGSL